MKTATSTATMMVCSSRRRSAVCLLLIFATTSHFVEAWSSSPDARQREPFLRHIKTTAATSTFAATLLGAILLPLDRAIAADNVSIHQSNNIDVVMSRGLSEPTSDQPQIKFSGNRPNQGPTIRTDKTTTTQQAGKGPILEGLIYIDRPNSRPNFADTLVLTAGTVDHPDEVLAGAKFAITKARFPMQFSMYQQNVIRGKEEMWSKAKEGDIFVTARVCPEDVALPCSDEESTYKAKGISKLIRNLPGMEDGTVIRTPISLPLK